jgi:hypothetical protein
LGEEDVVVVVVNVSAIPAGEAWSDDDDNP